MNGKQVGQTSGQHDQKDNRGSKGQEREGNVRYDSPDQTTPGGQSSQSSKTLAQTPANKRGPTELNDEPQD